MKKAKQKGRYFRDCGIPIPKSDMWPCYPGVFVHWPDEWESGAEAVPDRKAVVGCRGPISTLARPEKAKDAQKLFDLQCAFLDRCPSLHLRQRLAPRTALHHPSRCRLRVGLARCGSWPGEDPTPTRFTRADGAPLGIAVLWDKWRPPTGEWVESYTMLTINANQHRPFKDTTSPGTGSAWSYPPRGAYGDWLTTGAADTMDFLNPDAANQLVAEPVIRTAVATPEQ
jgi:hypothetical protein